MDTATQASTKARVHLSWRDRYAGVIIWFSLFASVVGFLSAFHEFIPTLTRLSMLTKALFALYHIARDGLWHDLRTAFWWIHIPIPDIPVLWKDAIIITGLVLAALNFESMQRHRISLVISFAKATWENFQETFMENATGERWGLFNDETFSEKYVIWLIAPAGALTCVALGYLVYLLLSVLGVPVDLLAGRWSAVLDTVIFGSILLSYVTGYLTYSNRSFVTKLLFWPARIIFFPVLLVALVLVALGNGWRAMLLALGLVVFLIGTNYAFLAWIDPMLKQPPAFLQQLIDADPAKLPKSE